MLTLFLTVTILINFIKNKYLLVETNSEDGGADYGSFNTLTPDLCCDRGFEAFRCCKGGPFGDLIDNNVECMCPLNYAPVCGNDGNSYGNACGAGCEGVEVECDGKCPCHQGDDYVYIWDDSAPECCAAKCEGADIECDGDCPCDNEEEPCAIQENYSPVCGVDGKTYINTSSIGCAGVEVECDGDCPCDDGGSGCIIHADDWPVCGVDGETYPNTSSMYCAGVELECEGSCPCDEGGSGND